MDKAFDELLQVVIVFMVNSKMVDPYFVWNPVNPNSVGINNTTSKGEIPTNMTILGSHVKVSGNSYSFVTQCVHKENKQKQAQHGCCGNNEKEPEYKDPTVYLNLIVSLDINPAEIIASISYEWTHTNRQHI